ncbi:MAG: hypothetical protein K2O88_04335 [Paramuribaculum sp.]|nr:hypothetical protein [Paramuribaculum sp.]
MSKTTLKKAIQELDANQLRELIMDIYAANCDSRHYLDFFANPNINTLLDKARTAISKEVNRSSRGTSKARISVIKKAIASITCLQPGAEETLEIMQYAVVSLCLSAHIHYFKETLVNSTAKLLNDTLIYADRNQLLSNCLPLLERTISELPSTSHRRSALKQTLRNQLQTTLQSFVTIP